jgi:hypothetical protein
LGEEFAFRVFASGLYKHMGNTEVKEKLLTTFLEVRNPVITVLKGCKVALTTDSWASPNKLAFMGIMVSFLN